MNDAIARYRKMVLLLRQKSKDMPAKQRQGMVGAIISLEQKLVSALASKILTGGLDLNIAKYPPRIRKLLQVALNRRLHIVRTLEKIRQEQVKQKEERKKELERISFAHLKQEKIETLGNLTNTFSSFAKENSEQKKKVLHKLRGQQLEL